ncbi:MAG: hypothetical protein Kow00122_03500 [Thermoleophilia bacterium]
MRTRALAVLFIASILTAVWVGTALAATPQDIYNDYAAHGTAFEGSYTTAEIEAYLSDATIHQYGSPAVLTRLDEFLTAVLGVMRNEGKTFAQAVAQVLGAAPGGGRATFPFTGYELVIAVLGAAALVGSGWFLRRSSRRPTTGAR